MLGVLWAPGWAQLLGIGWGIVSFAMLAVVSAARLVWKVRIAWKRQQAFERNMDYMLHTKGPQREFYADQCDAALREMNDQ